MSWLELCRFFRNSFHFLTRYISCYCQCCLMAILCKSCQSHLLSSFTVNKKSQFIPKWYFSLKNAHNLNRKADTWGSNHIAHCIIAHGRKHTGQHQQTIWEDLTKIEQFHIKQTSKSELRWGNGTEAFQSLVHVLKVKRKSCLSALSEWAACLCWILNVFFKEPAHQNWCPDHKETLSSYGRWPLQM